LQWVDTLKGKVESHYEFNDEVIKDFTDMLSNQQLSLDQIKQATLDYFFTGGSVSSFQAQHN